MTNKKGRLAGKVAVVTGGNSGIGETTGHIFAREGAKIILMARREEQGQKVVAAIREKGGKATFIGCDVGNNDSVQEAVRKAASTVPVDSSCLQSSLVLVGAVCTFPHPP